MDKNVETGMLIEIYGDLLTKRQLSVLKDFYYNDYSLSEIASNLGITRQAVRDNIMKGETKLFEFEEKLKIMKKVLAQDEIIEKIYLKLQKIDKTTTDDEVAKIIENVKKEISSLSNY